MATYSLVLWWCCLGLAAQAAPPRPTFYLPFEGTARAPLAGGSGVPIRRSVGQSDTILDLLALGRERFVPGRVGLACDIGDQPLAYECAGNFRADEGTASFWVNPEWRGDDRNLYSTLFGAADWGMVYKYTDQASLTFGTAKPTTDLYYDCGTGELRGWRPGEWHHVAVTWSRAANQRRIYLDGRLCAQAPFPWHRPVERGPLFVGAGCTLYPNPVAHARMDEFALWDEPLDDATIAEIHALGLAGRPLWDVPAPSAAGTGALQLTEPRTPPPPEADEPQIRQTARGEEMSLGGWWAFVPLAEPYDTPPERWGLGRVPGYWTVPTDARDADGNPLRGAWGQTPLTQFTTARYQRRFVADPAWRGRRVLLMLEGVDGLAELWLGERRLGWLTAWEPEGWDITSQLAWGEANTLTILLRTRGGAAHAGIYGDVSLRLVDGPYLHDAVVRPRVTAGRIEVSCDIYEPDRPREAELVGEIRPRDEPEAVALRFVHPCRLAPRAGEALSDQFTRVEASIEWPGARPWTIDDPYLYDLTLTLRAGDRVLARGEPVRFGFRELVQEGGGFLLNGKPFHLRGHQIDLAWPYQMDRVKELKPAGLNGLELSGPISSDWYRGIPYRQQLFREILDYCDEHGLVAAPILPDPVVLKDRVFDPAVAARYRRRLEKHIRTHGSHACIGLWYMDFNLAGYLWYCAPDKLDGSYKPENPGFAAKERYALEAERLAKEIDPRPIYHHACGNFGHSITSNLYLGPNSPTQEREEWPSAWAARRELPFLAVEHCCWLIPYWFRPRQFPLSVVYAGEPIFDELTALVRGPEAYATITPELFDRYDIGREPRGDRTRALIRHHPGYQAVKSEIARRSLRAWRTWGVPAIIFNAINWDFIGDDGRPLPVMSALARYFGDTDLYLAGPGDDWPSKDHAFYAGETIRKQAVLLNDLQHDIPVTLQWRLFDAAGRVQATGRIETVAAAGTPTFAPIELTAPEVTDRAEYTLMVEPVAQPRDDFQPESFAVQVFPRPTPIESPVRAFVYDPVGDTTKVLRQAGVNTEPLAADSDLSRAPLLVVGRRAWNEEFLGLARALDLETAIRGGMRLVVFEQTEGSPFGLRLEETSTRDAFIAWSAHPLLDGLAPADMHDLRGESDLIEPYPPAAPETRTRWPARCWKWSNRGVLATYVYTRPHYAPFRPVLACGFDLVQSPLLTGRFGSGEVILCQLDVTGRYGIDPVSTTLVHHLLQAPSDLPPPTTSRYVGEAARAFLARFGVEPTEFRPGDGGVVVVGDGPLAPDLAAHLEAAAHAGATVVLLPRSTPAPLGPPLADGRWFIGRLGADPLLASLNDGDLYPKTWITGPVIAPTEGRTTLVEPGLLAAHALGAGRLLACQVDPDGLSPRGRVKALRFWNVLLANLGVDRPAASFLAPPASVYEDDVSEQMPPYMGW